MNPWARSQIRMDAFDEGERVPVRRQMDILDRRLCVCFQGVPDMERFSAGTEPVTNDPERTLAIVN
jgi:hypothetical protein